VTQPPAATTVWIVDDDLGFVWWLGEVFTDAGCRTLPALSCAQAMALIDELRVGIDLLIVNPQLPGVTGMLETLRSTHPKLKTVVIGSSPPERMAAIRPQAFLERPTASDSVSRPDWVKKVLKLLKELIPSAAVLNP
jgi:DNA-binding NtrC family response regulator